MAETVYLVGIDPRARLSIHSTPAISSRFERAATYVQVRNVVDDLAAGVPVRLCTDYYGVMRAQRIVAELGDA